jgi:membrane fusion protein (multidrug efflux system)
MRPVVAAAILLASSLAVAGCGDGSQAENGPGAIAEVPVNVRVLTVERTDLPEHLAISGPLRPIHGTDVSTEESGVVADIPRDKGSSVARDEVVVLLEREVLEASMRAAEAGRDLAAYTAERTQKLFEAKQASREEAFRAETELEEAKANADIARLRWERAAVKAPLEGIVADRYVEAGEFVTAGTPVARIVDPYTLKLTSHVSEREVMGIEPGSPARVTLDGLQRAVDGYVHWISFEAEPMSGKFQVEVRIDNRDLALRPGVVARAEVLTRVHEGVLVVPRDAVILGPAGPSVFVVDGDRAKNRTVTLGPDQGLMAIVLDGLTDRERIVVRGQRDLRDDSLVEVREVALALDGSLEDDPFEVKAAASEEPADVRTVAEGHTP